MNYEIKKASLEDLDTAAELFNLYRVFYRQADDLEKCKQFIKERLDNDQSIFLIIYVDGKPVGFTQLYKLYHYLRWIYYFFYFFSRKSSSMAKWKLWNSGFVFYFKPRYWVFGGGFRLSIN